MIEQEAKKYIDSLNGFQLLIYRTQLKNAFYRIALSSTPQSSNIEFYGQLATIQYINQKIETMSDDCLTPEEKTLIESGNLSPEAIQAILEMAIARSAS